MSITVIPDRVISQAIKEGLTVFRTNPKLLATLFQNLTDPEFEQVVNFIAKAPIAIHLNFPKANLQAPAIILTLKSEQEDISFLGDHMGTSPLYGLPPQEHLYDTRLGHAASQSVVSNLGEKVLGHIAVAAYTPGTKRVYIQGATYQEWYTSWVSGNSEYSGYHAMVLHVSVGSGRGQQVDISSFGENYIDILTDLSINLDSTSKVDIRLSNTSLLLQGEPVRVYNEGDVVSRKGAYYAANYTLDVVAGNQEEVIHLFSVIKAIFFLFKTSLEAQGIQNLSLSGSDFGTKSAYLPDNLFNRSLNLQFSYPFSVLVDEETIRNLELCLSPNNGEHIDLTPVKID